MRPVVLAIDCHTRRWPLQGSRGEDFRSVPSALLKGHEHPLESTRPLALGILGISYFRCEGFHLPFQMPGPGFQQALTGRLQAALGLLGVTEAEALETAGAQNLEVVEHHGVDPPLSLGRPRVGVRQNFDAAPHGGLPHSAGPSPGWLRRPVCWRRRPGRCRPPLRRPTRP